MHKIKEALGERFFALKLLLILATLLLIVLYLIVCSRKGGDFVTFIEAATKMWNGQNIYSPPYTNLRYSYSPFWAMVLVPLALLPEGVGAFMWLLLSLIMLLRTLWLLREKFGVRQPEQCRNDILWILILLYISRYLELNFHHVQMTIFLVWLMLEALYCSVTNRELTAGLLIGTGTIIKIMPVVMIPYLIYRRQWIAALSSIATVVICFFLPMIFTGKALFWEMNQSWYTIVRPDSPEFQSDAAWHLPQNLSLLVYRMLADTGAPYTRPLLHLTYGQATTIVWMIIGALILLSLYFLRSWPFVRVYSRPRLLYEMSYIMLLIPLIFPHQMKYAFYFVLPAISCLMLYLVDAYSVQKSEIGYKLIAVLVLLSFLLCTATTDLLIGMDLSTITQHFKTITVGTLLLIPALMLIRRYFAGQE